MTTDPYAQFNEDIDAAFSNALAERFPRLASAVLDLVKKGEPNTRILAAAKAKGAGPSLLTMIEAAANHYRKIYPAGGVSRTENP